MIKLKDLLIEAKRRQLQIPVMDKLKVDKILKQARAKVGKDYDSMVEATEKINGL